MSVWVRVYPGLRSKPYDCQDVQAVTIETSLGLTIYPSESAARAAAAAVGGIVLEVNAASLRGISTALRRERRSDSWRRHRPTR